MKTRFKILGRNLAVLALATIAVGAYSGSAYADRHDDRHYDRDRHDDEWRRHHRVYYGPQTYVQPPPPVYYAPPPPPIGLNLFFHVR